MSTLRCLPLFLLALTTAGCAGLDDGESLGETSAAAIAEPAPVIVQPAKFRSRADGIPDRYIVVLRGEPAGLVAADRGAATAATHASIDRLAAAHQAAVRHRYTAALRGFAATLTEADARTLAADPDVDYVEADVPIELAKMQLQRGATWGLDRLDQLAPPLDARYAYPDGAGRGAVAYIVDSGIRPTHVEFAQRLLPGFTAIADGLGTLDCNGHGTHVAGTVAGSTLGVAKRAAIVPVRVFDCTGKGDASTSIAGLDFVLADGRPNAVVNMSLSAAANDATDLAARTVIAAGIPVIAAASNSNIDACVRSPARVPEVITVAASDPADARAPFSNFGACVDVFAPGVDIASASFSSDTGVALSSGTSMASPHVAGLAALYRAENPTATPAQVAAALIDHATPDRITDPRGSPNRLVSTLVFDTTAPTVAITSPADGAEVGGGFAVTVAISDDYLAEIALLVDGQPVERRAIDAPERAPFELQIPALAAGAHTLTLTATDRNAQTASTSIRVTALPPGSPPPEHQQQPADASTAGCTTGGGGGLALVAAALLATRRRRAKPA